MDINYLKDIKQKYSSDEVNKFLKYLDEYPNKIQYVRIQVLQWNEQPLQGANERDVYIEGRAIGGSVNLNGDSNVRRNGSISVCLDETDDFYKVENIENILSLNKKIKIEIGYDIEFKYDELPEVADEGNRVWFPLGIFIIKNPSVNRSLSGLTLSLTISDKMSLLNGENGGSLPAAVVFSETDIQNSDGTYSKQYNKVKDIIKTLLVDYGGIDSNKVKINDVEDSALQVMKWSGDTKLYKYTQGGSAFIDSTLSDGIEADKDGVYQPNANIGFILTDFIWPGQALSANIGETITSVLDKIKTLSDYEYFFDVEGNFIWQKKKTYIYDNSKNLKQDDFYTNDKKVEKIVKPTLNSDAATTYDFENSPLIISYSNTPQYKNVKNDYIIWGKRKTSSGAELPIRYHILFDTPIVYSGKTDTEVSYYKYLVAEPDVYGFQVVTKVEGLPTTGIPEKNKYYTVTVNGESKNYIYDFNLKRYKEIEIGTRTFSNADDWRTLLYFRGKRAEAVGETQTYFNNPLYKDLEIEWPKLYDMETKSWRTKYPDGDTIDYYCHIINAGDNLNYSSVGRYQTKVLNDTNINCIYTPGIGDNLILRIGEAVPKNINNYITSYTVVRVSDEIYQQLYTGGSQNSAFEQARTLITSGTGYANTISISAIPIYYLEPNTLINVKDEESSINGTYAINSISLPLAYNGTMTISASKAVIR